MDFLIEKAGVELLLGEELERLLARTQDSGRELHGEHVVAAEAFGIVLHHLVEHLEEELELLLALLEVFELVMDLREVEEQTDEEGAELSVAEAGEVAHLA